MQKQIQGFGVSRLAASWAHGYTQLHVMLRKHLGVRQDFAPTSAAQPDPAACAHAVELFAQALNEDSNLELDWLWYATKMTSNAQRRVCFQRALQINPDSEAAKRALVTLAREESA